MAGNIIAAEYSFWQQGAYILNDNDIAFFINGLQNDDDIKYRAVNALRGSKAMLGVNKIDIINRQNSIYFGENMSQVDVYEYASENTDFAKYYEKYKNGENFFISEDNSTVTYFYNDYRGFTVVFNINYDELENKIVYANLPEPTDIWVYYKNDVPIISSEGDIMQNGKIAQNILTEDSHSSFVYNGDFYIYTYLRGVLCISRTSYMEVVSEAIGKASFIWFLAILLIILIAAASYFISKYAKNMFLKYAQNLAIVSSRSKLDKTKLAIMRLFTNPDDNMENEDEVYNIFKNKKYLSYVVLMFVMDKTEKAVYNKINTTEYHTKICQIINKVLSSGGESFCANFSSDRIGVLYATDNPEAINFFVKKINETVKKECEITLTVIKSTEENNVAEMLCHIPAVIKLAKYRFILGCESFIEEENVKILNDKCEYPLGIQMKIVDAFKKDDAEKARELLDEFIEYIDENDYTVAENWTLMLFINVIRNIEFSGKTADFRTIAALTENNTFSDAAEMFVDYMQADEMKPNKPTPDNEFVNRIKQITEENYNNPEYDLNFLAQLLGITSVHASRKFKKLSGQNFSQYLAACRIEKAKQLIKTTDLKVGEIGQMCGFSSTTYFVTVFKKHMFMTPQEYQLKIQK